MNAQQLHGYNETAAIVIAFTLNSLLVFCVLKENDRFLRAYKNVILFGCFSEFLFIGIVTYVRPQVIFVENALVVVLSGPFHGASQTHLNVATCFFVWSICYDCTKLLIEFTARYQIVCNGTRPTVLRLFSMTAAVYIGTSFQVICFYTSFASNPIAYRDLLLSDSTWTEDVRLAASDTRTWGCRAFVLGGTIATIVTYGIIFVCSRKITFVLSAQSAVFSPKTQKLQRGLSYMLFLQAIVPICISIVPATLSLIALLLGFGSKWLSLLISMMLHWTPCVGPAFTLMCIPTYRSRICSLFCFRFTSKSTTSIAPIDSRLRSSRIILPELNRHTFY
ncbi:hypothetical protein M3Y94_00012400 [Aphelenchoides besseyi]|nr:hypothetical protein M3Y94_00012400 [Aphelenchoides besseyi]